jgi:translation initiation factor 3 subunit A
MPPLYVKPETVLKRSEELLALGTPQSQQQGLESLMEVFQSKRFKQTSLTVLEPIILKFLELCTALRKPRLARDGLGLYKLASQQVSIPSLEKVLLAFIKGAEDKLAAAQEEARKILGDKPDGVAADDKESTAVAGAGVDEDDLELPLQPYTLLVDSLLNEPTNESDLLAKAGSGTVTSADRERVERAIVTPWMRFCWEAYKSCLEVAKSNARLEVIYQVRVDLVHPCKGPTSHANPRYTFLTSPLLRTSPSRRSSSAESTAASPSSVVSASSFARTSPTPKSTRTSSTPSTFQTSRR